MYDAGAGYLDAIQSRNIRKEWYGDITLNNGVTIFFDKTNIKDGFGELTQRCSSDSAIDIGTVYASSLTMQFKNLGVDRYALIDAELILMEDVIHMGHASAASWDDISSRKWIDYASTIWSGIMNQDTHYRFPMGVYIIKESMQTQDSIKITAYDRMLLLDKELPATIADNAKSPYAWIATACAACGIPLGTSRYDFYAMPNGQKTVKFANSDTETKTWRDLVAGAAALMGANLVMDRHGYLTAEQVADKSNKNYLVNSIKNLKTLFPTKRVHIVECAYNFQYWPTSGVNYDTRDAWPCSIAGQYAFVKDLVDALKPLSNVDGINYWFPEEAGNGDDTNWSTSKGTVITTWLNRGFWNEGQSSSGHAINKTGNVGSGKTAADVCAPYYMGTFIEGTQDIEAVGEPASAVKKLMNGQVVIERNGNTYTLDGKQITR